MCSSQGVHCILYVRRISVVFHRNFTGRDNQYVRFSLYKQPVRLQILRNFVVHKAHTRKTCLTEPLRRIIEPLRKNIEPHCGIIESLRRNVEHHCEIIEPIQRNIWPHYGTIEPLRRKVDHFSSKAKKNMCEYEVPMRNKQIFFGKPTPCITRRKCS